MSGLEDWLHEHESLLTWVGVGLAVVLAVVALMVPRLVARVPADYFAHEKRAAAESSGGKPVLSLLKDIRVFVLLLAGLAMLVLPGPGTVTILLGIVLMDFPGKYKLERAIVRRPAVLKSLNATRAKAGVPPLQV